MVFIVAKPVTSLDSEITGATLFTRTVRLPQCHKRHQCRHCLHMRNLNSDLVYLLIFRCKHSQYAGYQCHVNRTCNPWMETWDVAIMYTGGNKDLCHCAMDNYWPHDIVPSKIKFNLNCRCQLTCDHWRNPKHKAEVFPVHNHCTTLQPTLWQFFTIRTSTNEIWCLDFNRPGLVT